jgi:hypothetical protein
LAGCIGSRDSPEQRVILFCTAAGRSERRQHFHLSSADSDMLAAESSYASLEAALKDELDHYQARHPGL